MGVSPAEARTPMPVIAIVGAGVSGTLLAVNLLREPEPTVVLIEQEPRKVARGVAYATTDSTHLLNVRAANMSAFPDQQDHFLKWLDVGEDQRNRFVPRQAYGAYLEDLLDAALAAHPDRLHLVTGRAVSATRVREGWVIEVAGHGRVAADTLILAQGNLPPAELPEFENLSAPVYQTNPWAAAATADLGENDAVLLVGTGLTAIDMVLSLVRRGFEGRIVALSRRGLKPRSHAAEGPNVGYIDRPSENGSRLIRHLRRRAEGIDWRCAIDELRLHTQDLWRRMDNRERERFLRHARPFWDIHRHRLAPSIAEQIEALEASGQLRFLAGRVEHVVRDAGQIHISWRPRGEDAGRRMTVRRIINCTGPLGDLAASEDPLIRDLVRQGFLRPDALKLGADVDTQARVIDARGNAQPDLLAIGPMARGEAWEITAVPDIRRQVWDVARHLTHSQWVTADGL